MKCFSKGSVIQSHCAKMREVICTQAKLAIYMLYICKNKAGKDSTKYQAKEGPNHSAVSSPDTFRKYLRWLIYNKGGLHFNPTDPLNSQDFLSPQLPGVCTTFSTDNTVNCYSFVPKHLQSLVACSSMTETKHAQIESNNSVKTELTKL